MSNFQPDTELENLLMGVCRGQRVGHLRMHYHTLCTVQSDESHVDTRPGKVLESKYRGGLFHLCRQYFNASLPITPNPSLTVGSTLHCSGHLPCNLSGSDTVESPDAN